MRIDPQGLMKGVSVTEVHLVLLASSTNTQILLKLSLR